MDPLRARILNHAIPVRSRFRNPLMHPQTIYPNHGRFLLLRTQEEAIRPLYDINLRVWAEAKTLPKWLGDHDAAGSIN